MLKQTFPKIITFIEDFEKDLPFIYADRIQIHQALLNLCINARDAMPNGGTITIKAEKQDLEQVRARFTAAGQDFYVCISITDTGEGMDETTRLRAFDPFFTTKPVGKGTGMGLSVVYGIIHAHHGFVDLESELGRGTTIRLYLPVATTDEHIIKHQQPSESFDIGGTETILIVEDENFLIEMLQLMLESKGYTVYSAQDGLKAIELYKQHREEIALILTDMGLPELTGFDEFKRLREIDPNVKVVFASGFFEPDIKSELLKAGAKGFIQKPYEASGILRIIREILDKK
jgi:CheY-like chemotaxis protein